MNIPSLKSRPRALYIAVQAILLCSAGNAALAEETKPKTDEATLPTITVTAEKEASYTGKKASTSTRLDLSLKETPQSVTVITRKQIEDLGATNLGTLLTQTTGVVLTGDNTERSSFSIRGFGTGDSWSSGIMQYDGVAVNTMNVGQSKPDMAMFDSVEIIRGAAGLTQGSGEPSGAINLIRKKPTAEFQANGLVSFGRWNSVRSEVDVSNKLNESGSVRGRLVLAYQDADSFMTAVTRDSNLVYGIVSADLTTNTLLNVGYTYQGEHAVPVNSLPRYTDGSDIGLSRKNCGCLASDYWDKSNTNIFLDLSHQFDNGWQLKGTYSQSQINMDMVFTSLSGKVAKGSNDSAVNKYAYQYKQDVKVYDFFAKGPFTLFGREHQLVIGANSQRSSTPGRWTSYDQYLQDNTLWSAGADPENTKEGKPISSPIKYVNIFNFGPYDLPFVQPRYSEDGGNSYETKRQHGVYVTTQLNIADPFKVIAGARLSNFEYESLYKSNVTGQFVPSRTTAYKKSDVLTPYMGFTYDLTSTYTAYASYADTFVVQNVKNQGGSLLDPLEGEVYEVGIKGSFNDDMLIATLSAFRTNQINRPIDDLSSPNPCPGSASGYCKVASGEVISEGIEAELRGEVLPNLNVSLGYTYNTTEYAKDLINQGRVFNENTPEHLARLFTTYKLPNQLTIGGGVNYQSDWEVGRYGATPAKQPAYALLNLMASYPINDKLTVALNATNVFDKKYYSYITSTVNRYGDPANVTLTLRAKF